MLSIRVGITIQHINNTSDTGRQKKDLLHSRRGFAEDFLCATQQQTDTGNVAWEEINPGIYQLLEISFIGRRKNRLFEYDTRRVLRFISVLSLRMEGGRERGRRGGGREGEAHCAVDRIGFVCDEWGCHRRWQVCVQYMWMYNTLCIPWQAGSLFVPMISKSLHLWLLMADTVAEGCCRSQTVWEQKCQTIGWFWFRLM